MIYLNAQANKSTCKLVDSSTNKKGYPAFHAPPYGGYSFYTSFLRLI